MAITHCAECKAQISTTASACPQCGARVPKTKWWLWIPLGLVGGFFLIGSMLAANDPQSGERADARRVIDLCWQEQKRASLSRGSQQFIAQSCERLEDEYRRKYNRNP